MALRTVIHVGLPKTGTTYLQTAMWKNRDALRERGFLYPGDSRMHHFQAAKSVGGVAGPEGLADRRRVQLIRAARDWSGTALLSHEFFSQATRHQAAQLIAELGDTELLVVITARDYQRQLPAVWQESLKMGNPGTLGEFADRMLAPGHQSEIRRAHEAESVVGSPLRRAWGWSTQDLAAVLQRWADAAGADRLRLVTVPQAGAPRTTLWERWCEVIALDDTGLDLTAATANESLGAAQARVLTRVVDQLSPDFGDAPTRHRWLRQYLGHEVLVPQGGQRIGLSPRHVQALIPFTDAMLEEVAAAGYAVTGDLSELRGAAPSASQRDPDAVPDDEALGAAAAAIERMTVDVRELSTGKISRSPHRATPVRAVSSGAWRRVPRYGRALTRRVKARLATAQRREAD